MRTLNILCTGRNGELIQEPCDCRTRTNGRVAGSNGKTTDPFVKLPRAILNDPKLTAAIRVYCVLVDCNRNGVSKIGRRPRSALRRDC